MKLVSKKPTKLVSKKPTATSIITKLMNRPWPRQGSKSMVIDVLYDYGWAYYTLCFYDKQRGKFKNRELLGLTRNEALDLLRKRGVAIALWNARKQTFELQENPT